MSEQIRLTAKRLSIVFAVICLAMIYAISPAPAYERAKGWWIIVGTFPTEPWQRQKTDYEWVQARAAPCGLRTFNDFSGKFRGFRPGYNVFVVGAFATKPIANVKLRHAKKCFPDAYVKYGEHLGE